MGMKTRFKHVTILGAGAWGTTLAKILGEKDIQVSLWTRRPELAKAINATHQNPDYLPGITLPPSIIATTDLKLTDLIIYAVPSKFFEMANQLKALKNCPPILIATKGLIDHNKSLFLDDYFGTIDTAILSGPNLALEIAQTRPAAAVVASQNIELAKDIQTLLNCPYFRTYTSTDSRGVALGGILKNIIAIASGILDGLELGDNAKAAMLARALHEMQLLGVALGGDTATFYGLSGLGDLIATCNSTQSRNWQVGYKTIHPDTNNSSRSVPEGVRTTQVIYQIAKKKGVPMPITDEVYAVLYENKSPKLAIESLMRRDLKSEL